jgi:hypothetical protein
MKLKAIKYIRYAGKPVQPGQVFECNDADVRVLLAIRTAEKYVEPPPKKVPAIFKPFAPVIEEEAKAEEKSDEDKPKRGYKRRDMTAE